MIKQPFYFYLSLLLLAAAAWFGSDRLIFLKTARHVQGTVVDVSAANGNCGRRYSRSCTKFTAAVSYIPAGQQQVYTLHLSAGTASGANQPPALARLHYLAPVAVVYSPAQPSEAYEDTVEGVWRIPLMIMLFQLIALVTSFTEPRYGRSSWWR